MNFSRISWDEAAMLIQQHGREHIHIVDVRDERSFDDAHVEGALHLDGSSIAEFIEHADKAMPVLVYCYHGNTSQGAASYLVERGFIEAYSIDGGFEEYR